MSTAPLFTSAFPLYLPWPGTDKDDEEIPPADADEYARLSAYSRYRILLLYTMLGTSEEAQMVFNQLQETSLPGSPGYPYAVMAGLFWETYQQKEDLTAACLQVTQYADVHTEEVLSPLNSTTYGFNQPDLYTQNLCITE